MMLGQHHTDLHYGFKFLMNRFFEQNVITAMYSSTLVYKKRNMKIVKQSVRFTHTRACVTF